MVEVGVTLVNLNELVFECNSLEQRLHDEFSYEEKDIVSVKLALIKQYGDNHGVAYLVYRSYLVSSIGLLSKTDLVEADFK